MNLSMHRTLGLGLGALAICAASSSAACDPAFNTYSISAAKSNSGHIAVSRGTDGVIRISENITLSGWGGWLPLTKSNDNGYSDAWIQPYVTSSGNFVYSKKGDSLIQWRLGNYYSTWAVFRSGFSGVSSMTGSPTSAQLSSAIPTAVAANFGGRIKYRAQATNEAWGAWMEIPGLSTAVGSPVMEQVSPTSVNIFFRTSDNRIAQTWWSGTSWSGWVYLNATAVSADPNINLASVYDATNSKHYLYYMNNSGTPVQMTYNGSWISTNMTIFNAKKSLTAVVTPNNGVIVYGLDYQNNTHQIFPAGPQFDFEANCVIPKN